MKAIKSNNANISKCRKDQTLDMSDLFKFVASIF